MKNFLFILLFLLSVATNQAVCQTVETDEKSEPENVEQQERQLGLDDLQGGWRINSGRHQEDVEVPMPITCESDLFTIARPNWIPVPGSMSRQRPSDSAFVRYGEQVAVVAEQDRLTVWRYYRSMKRRDTGLGRLS